MTTVHCPNCNVIVDIPVRDKPKQYRCEQCKGPIYELKDVTPKKGKIDATQRDRSRPV